MHSEFNLIEHTITLFNINIVYLVYTLNVNKNGENGIIILCATLNTRIVEKVFGNYSAFFSSKKFM